MVMTNTKAEPPVALRAEVFARRTVRSGNDDPLRVDRPRTWIVLSALGVIAVTLLVFGFAGKLPQKLEAVGIVERGGNDATIQSITQGQVRSILVTPGDEIAENDPILELSDADGARFTIVSPFAGRVAELFIAPGNIVFVGDDVFAMARSDVASDGLLAYAFLDAEDVGSVVPGMSVDVIPLALRQFGVIRGEVVSVNSTPSSETDIGRLLRNDGLADQFTRDADPFVAQIRLEADASNASGVRWSNGSGPSFLLAADTPVTLEIHQGTIRPIDLMFGG